jgi:hypothetical protein
VPQKEGEKIRLYRLRKNSGLRGFVSGHDFSRAEDERERGSALAAEVIHMIENELRQGLKPLNFSFPIKRHDSSRALLQGNQSLSKCLFQQPVEPLGGRK